MASKSHNRWSCCCSEGDMNTYEDFFFSFQWNISGWSSFCSLVCLPPPHPPFCLLKGWAFSHDLSTEYNKIALFCLRKGMKIRFCELRGTLSAHVLTQTYTCIVCGFNGSSCIEVYKHLCFMYLILIEINISCMIRLVCNKGYYTLYHPHRL